MSNDKNEEVPEEVEAPEIVVVRESYSEQKEEANTDEDN